MKRRIGILILSVSLFLSLAGCGTSDTVRFGIGDEGGIYYAYGSALAQVLSAGTENTKIEAKETAGSAANIRLLSEDYLQMALAQSDLLHDAYYGRGSFEDQTRGYKAVAALYTESCQIVVRGDSEVFSISDLQGKTVSIGEEESGTEQNAIQILEASGLTDEMVDLINLDYEEASKQLSEGKIDGFFCTAGVQTKIIAELAAQTDIRLLSIDEETRERLCDAYKFYTESVIEAGTYSGQEEAVRTLGVKAVLVVSDALSDQIVQAITRAVFEENEALQNAVSVALITDPKESAEGVSIPFHPGAASYYNDLGIKVSTEGEVE